MSQLLSNFVYNVNNNPVTVSAAIRQVLLLLVVLHVVSWTIEQQGAILMAANALLDLFVKGSTIAHTRIDEKVTEQVAAREVAGTTGTGTGLFKVAVAATPKTPDPPNTPGM